jgi:hypothetical protein
MPIYPQALNQDVNNIKTSAEYNGLEWAGKVSAVGEIITAPLVVGIKTVTAVAAEIFAGASAKSNRRKLLLKNENAILRFRVGPSSVTQQNGFPVEPGAVVEFQFDPAIAVAIYAISEGAELNMAVMEI